MTTVRLPTLRQALTLISLVAVFYSGCGPSPRAKEAVRGLASLKSVISVGVTYPDYIRRLGDVKITLDEGADDLNRRSKSGAEAARKSFYFYQTAGTLWKSNLDLDTPDGVSYLRTMATLYTDCPDLMRLKDAPDYEVRGGLVQAAWACAGARLAEAEQQIK